MSFIIMRVYSFECDLCGVITEIGPEAGDARHAERLLRKVHGWGVASGASQERGHVCPKHVLSGGAS